jgi:hypothetical protein
VFLDDEWENAGQAPTLRAAIDAARSERITDPGIEPTVGGRELGPADDPDGTR